MLKYLSFPCTQGFTGARATFINVKSSTILSHLPGEFEKLIHALFSLARKLGPTIIFIDEIDSLFGHRGGIDGINHLAQMQGLFLQLWDGMGASGSVRSAPVIVIGATNRPGAIDEAFLRRLSYRVEFTLPDTAGRLDILSKFLSKVAHVGPDVNLESIAAATDGCSGADLGELFRLALIQRMKERRGGGEAPLRGKQSDLNISTSSDSSPGRSQDNLAAPFENLRPLAMADFHTALATRQLSAESFEHSRG